MYVYIIWSEPFVNRITKILAICLCLTNTRYAEVGIGGRPLGFFRVGLGWAANWWPSTGRQTIRKFAAMKAATAAASRRVGDDLSVRPRTI